MLVRVIKETIRTITAQEVFVIEADSEEQAKTLIESSGKDGFYSETVTKSPTLTYASALDTDNWAKLEVRLNSNREKHIVYSPTLDSNDIERAIIEQLPQFSSAYCYEEHQKSASVYLDLSGCTGTVSATVTVLQKPVHDNNKLLAKTRLIMARHKAKDELKKPAKLDVHYDDDHAEFSQDMDNNG